MDAFPKMVNWIMKQERGKANHTRYLHIISDTARVRKDPKPFMEALARMMSCLHLESWLNTTCDPMNYVYKKYCPRLDIRLDGEDAKLAGTSRLLFTSHANTVWSCYDLDAPEDHVAYNEALTFPMYYIVEFLARRRKNAGRKALDFMNMYPTVPEETGLVEVAIEETQNFTDQQIQENDEKFKALDLDWTATNNVDAVLETLYNIIKKKG